MNTLHRNEAENLTKKTEKAHSDFDFAPLIKLSLFVHSFLTRRHGNTATSSSKLTGKLFHKPYLRGSVTNYRLSASFIGVNLQLAFTGIEVTSSYLDLQGWTVLLIRSETVIASLWLGQELTGIQAYFQILIWAKGGEFVTLVRDWPGQWLGFGWHIRLHFSLDCSCVHWLCVFVFFLLTWKLITLISLFKLGT